MRVDLYSSSFCAPCAAARSVLAEAERLVPALTVSERNVAAHPEVVERERISSTPTLVVRADDGREVFRAEGAPTLAQLLAAVARAV